MLTAKSPTVAVLTSLAVSAMVAAGFAYAATTWRLIPKAGLTVTEGTITSAGPKALLRTKDPGMRAVARDGGRHARSASVFFVKVGLFGYQLSAPLIDSQTRLEPAIM